MSFKTGVVLGIVVIGCGTASAPDGGVDSGGGGPGGGTAGGVAMNQPLGTCTPEGLATAPTTVSLLPVGDLTSADEHQAYASFDANDGGTPKSVTVSLSAWSRLPDGGQGQLPAGLSVRVNGCALDAPRAVPGVGLRFDGAGNAWRPTPDRWVVFEVVDPQVGLVYRNVMKVPAVLPHVTAVRNPAGPMLTVEWAPIPDAGVRSATMLAFQRIGAGGLMGVGSAMVSPAAGTVTVPIQGGRAANEILLELDTGGPSFISRLRLASEFRVP